MTDDYLADFERELHAAAQRRAAPAPSRRRWLAPAFATATAAAAVMFVLVIAGPAERELEVPGGNLPAGGQVELTALAPHAAASCEPRERDLDPDDFPLSILRRAQHPPDALFGDVIRFDAVDYDPRITRAPTGIGELVVLSPTSGVGCEGDEPGVCLFAVRGSKCFTLSEIEAGRAVVLTEPRVAVGIVPDGVEAVTLEPGGRTAVVENAFRAELPAGTRSVGVELIGTDEGCAPPQAMRRVVPVLDREPADGGVPPAIRNSFGKDSPVIGRHARIAGGGDGITYWVVPRLRCDGAGEDTVCVVPLHEDDANAREGGGAACGRLDQLGRTFMSFPLREEDGTGVAGLAPEGATMAHVGTEEPNFEQAFEVKDGVWAGTLDRREVRELRVRFDSPASPAPRVAVLNGTTITGLGQTVMDALVDVNYRRTSPGVADWREHDLVRSFVYHAPGKEWLGERIATYLRESMSERPLEVREMTDEVRELVPADAEAVVVAGRDLAG